MSGIVAQRRRVKKQFTIALVRKAEVAANDNEPAIEYSITKSCKSLDL